MQKARKRSRGEMGSEIVIRHKKRDFAFLWRNTGVGGKRGTQPPDETRRQEAGAGRRARELQSKQHQDI